MSVFEILMLICFGAAWPFSVYKSYVSGTNKGKSLLFLCTILFGYVCGVVHKLHHSNDGVIYLYAFNGALVFADILLYYRNSGKDKGREGQPGKADAH